MEHVDEKKTQFSLLGNEGVAPFLREELFEIGRGNFGAENALGFPFLFYIGNVKSDQIEDEQQSEGWHREEKGKDDVKMSPKKIVGQLERENENERNEKGGHSADVGKDERKENAEDENDENSAGSSPMRFIGKIMIDEAAGDGGLYF